MKKFNLKSLAISLSTIIMATATTQAKASDIEIYQPPSAGATSLVFMLDISGSMNIRSVAQDYLQDNSANVTWGVLTDRDRDIYNSQFHYNKEDSGRGYTRNYRYVTTDNARNSTSVRTGCVPMQGGYKCYDRMSRLQDAFYLLLNGGTDLLGNQIERLSDDKVIGLSSLGAFVSQAHDTGRMIVPARRLDADVGGKTQRQILTEEMAKMTPSTNTPTARSFAEVVAYFMGKNTTSPPSDYKTTATQYLYIPDLNNRYRCTNAYPTRCNASPTGSQFLLFPRDVIGRGTDPDEVKLSWTSYPIALREGVTDYTSYSGYTYLKNEKIIGMSGFQYSAGATKDSSGANYVSPLETGGSCAAQGVYVLTDGEPTQDTGSEGLFASAFGEEFSCPQTGDSLFCAIEASKKLLSGNHAKSIPIKTAVVGFGDSFNKIPSYDPTLSEAENLINVGVRNGDIVGSLASGTNIEQKRAAAWGIVGGGGWYSGSSTQSVVDSVNAFLQQLGVDIPAMTTGSPTVPVSSLNRQTLLSDAYYASFTPQPSGTQQLWVGNMNKYETRNGVLFGQSDRPLFQNGLVDATALGLWDREVDGGVATGVLGNLKLRTDEQNNTQRQVYTEGTGDARTLTQVTVDALRDGALSTSTAKNHWLNLLGYNVAESETVNFNNLSQVAELRQLGATMHSSPLLLTQSGRINRNLEESNRDDYILYGSTQGVLHIVDADTGEEKFAFVPQKMVERQKEAFLHEKATTGGKERLFYGIDGVWVNHTEYVARADGTLTVGAVSETSKGKQWVYGGLRMGGRNYYGLDLSSIANRAKELGSTASEGSQVTGAPVLKFNIDPDAQAVYSPTGKKTYPELVHMGQSWSQPALGYVRWNGQRKLVMFVGGGYDEGYENSTYNQTNGVGAGVYMFDAENGDLLWWASNNSVTGAGTGVVKHNATGDDTSSLQYSVVSRINAIDRDSDGLIDALYFGDLAGQGFRIDLDNSANVNGSPTVKTMNSLRVVKIFDEHQADGTSPRIYTMPSVSVHEAEDRSRFAVVAFGSGDRSSPLAGARTNPATGDAVTTNTNTADDATLVIYDYDVGKSGWKNLSMDDLLTRFDKGALKTAVLESTAKGTEREVKADGLNQGWKYTYPATKKGQFKTFGEPYAIADLLFANVYDRDGGSLTGECGGGVVGVSQAYQFCLPTGICTENDHGYTTTTNEPLRSNPTPGLVEMTLGLSGEGIGNLGNISTTKESPINGGANGGGRIDCALEDNKSKPECLNVETPSTISQLRWFESRQEQN